MGRPPAGGFEDHSGRTYLGPAARTARPGGARAWQQRRRRQRRVPSRRAAVRDQSFRALPVPAAADPGARRDLRRGSMQRGAASTPVRPYCAARRRVSPADCRPGQLMTARRPRTDAGLPSTAARAGSARLRGPAHSAVRRRAAVTTTGPARWRSPGPRTGRATPMAPAAPAGPSAEHGQVQQRHGDRHHRLAGYRFRPDGHPAVRDRHARASGTRTTSPIPSRTTSTASPWAASSPAWWCRCWSQAARTNARRR